MMFEVQVDLVNCRPSQEFELEGRDSGTGESLQIGCRLVGGRITLVGGGGEGRRGGGQEESSSPS